MTLYESVQAELQQQPKKWLITGVAGFIGSNLLERLLKLDQQVVGLDNFSTGFKENLESVREAVSVEQWDRFTFFEGDICDYKTCEHVVKDADYVLHQAALGSVPRSINDPLTTNNSNITGFLSILHASKEARVKSFIYAASSSTYGDHPGLPKVEPIIGSPLSPYAVTKYVNELYAAVYAKTYGFNTIGLRYFNVFGPRQNPNGAYAAVIPNWIGKLLKKESIQINGDGTTSRDFCFIENVIQINILAACSEEGVKDNVFNVALGDRTSLNELKDMIIAAISENGVVCCSEVQYMPFRKGDVKHSQADISKAQELLGYRPTHKIEDGIKETVSWFLNRKTS